MLEHLQRRAPRMVALSLFGLVSACAKSGLGDVCVGDANCEAGFVCIVAGEDTGRCMQQCTAGTRLCSDGLICMTFGERNACFLGGDVGFREACSSNEACEAGTVCPPGVGVCAQACGGDLVVCQLVESCIQDAEVGGYCGARE